VFTARGHG